MAVAAEALDSIPSLPRRLQFAAALCYVLVFALVGGYGRPGSGLGELFFVPVVLAALAADLWVGAAAGAGAAVLYVAALGLRSPADVGGLVSLRVLLHLVAYAAAGAIVGAFARRARSLLAESVSTLDTLLELVQRDLGSGTLSARGLDAAVGRRLDRSWPFALLVGELEPGSRTRPKTDHDRLVREGARLVDSALGAEAEVARAGPTRLAVLVPASTADAAQDAAVAVEVAFGGAGKRVTFGWAAYPSDGLDGLSLVQSASERLFARRIVRGEWRPTAASAGLVFELPTARASGESRID